MSFDYETSGLPDNPQWKAAVETCHTWLTKHMSNMFGPERLIRFMHNQPITAAKHIMRNSPDWSEESVTLALLGPAKDAVMEGDVFSDKAKALFEAMTEKRTPDAAQQRDLVRLFLVDGLSTMNDQLIGRERIDKHHAVRWELLRGFEQAFTGIKGRNPILDGLFHKALADSRAALEKLDAPQEKAGK
jgi:hypothetical protein